MAPDLVVLSPHLDDAVLSCGGRIATTTAAGGEAVVITVFTAEEPPGSLNPFAAELRRRWKLPAGEVMARRKSEDLEACRRLGAEARHWEVPEALYRVDAGGAPLYRDVAELYGTPVPADAGLVGELAARIATLSDAGRLLAPLAVGGHVDHRLLRAAAEASGRAMAYYEDFPYTEWKWLALARALGRASDWEPEVLALEPALLERRAQAIEAYLSQVPSLFRTAGRLRRQLRRAARRAGGERVWRRRSTAAEPAR